MTDSINLNRQQLSAVFGNNLQVIKAFENVLKFVNTFTSSSVIGLTDQLTLIQDELQAVNNEITTISNINNQINQINSQLATLNNQVNDLINRIDRKRG